MSTLTSKFSDAFDPMNEAHVKWLGKFFDFAENLATKRGNIDDFINSNPMGIKVSKDDMADWVHVHFIVSMKYTRAIFKGKAKIPPN